jgi:hypothetical protein
MAYCEKCGTLNDDDTEYCKSCGEPLWGSRTTWRRSHESSICFGVPMQGQLIGLLLGLIIVLWGVTELLNLDIELWALVVIFFGVFIILNVLRRTSGT